MRVVRDAGQVLSVLSLQVAFRRNSFLSGTVFSGNNQFSVRQSWALRFNILEGDTCGIVGFEFRDGFVFFNVFTDSFFFF